MQRRVGSGGQRVRHNQFLGGEGFNGPLLAGYIQHGHGHLILGERAGFVRADRGDGAQGLDRRQFANQGMAL